MIATSAHTLDIQQRQNLSDISHVCLSSLPPWCQGKGTLICLIFAITYMVIVYHIFICCPAIFAVWSRCWYAVTIAEILTCPVLTSLCLLSWRRRKKVLCLPSFSMEMSPSSTSNIIISTVSLSNNVNCFIPFEIRRFNSWLWY